MIKTNKFKKGDKVHLIAHRNDITGMQADLMMDLADRTICGAVYDEIMYTLEDKKFVWTVSSIEKCSYEGEIFYRYVLKAKRYNTPIMIEEKELKKVRK